MPRTTTVQLSQSSSPAQAAQLPAMSSWMKTLQSGANKVGNEAAKLKLYAEISLLKGDIKSLKEAWGVTCFDLYSQGDANGVNASHAKQLVKIREKEAKVQAKIVELNKLKAPKEPVVVDSTFCCRQPV